MDVEWRPTTTNDLSYVYSAERGDDTSRFIHVWPREKHREARCDEGIEHLIVGFRCEGTLRECLAGPEGFESLVVMSILEQEYRGA